MTAAKKPDPGHEIQDVDAFIAEWDELARGERPDGDGHNCCRLCGTDVFPHEHSDGQREQRKVQIQAHIDAGIPLA